jgi:hypothetical protein
LLAEVRQNKGIRSSREIFAVAIPDAFRRKTDMRKMRQYHAIDPKRRVVAVN